MCHDIELSGGWDGVIPDKQSEWHNNSEGGSSWHHNSGDRGKPHNIRGKHHNNVHHKYNYYHYNNHYQHHNNYNNNNDTKTYNRVRVWLLRLLHLWPESWILWHKLLLWSGLWSLRLGGLQFLHWTETQTIWSQILLQRAIYILEQFTVRYWGAE